MTTQAALLAPRPASPLGSRRRRRRLRALLLLLPGIALVAAFLYWPLAFVVQLSLTEADSFLSPTGAIATTANYGALADRYLPNVLVTLQLATLASIVDLVFGFPFAYILVRRVRYRNIVRALMVFPMFGALYVAFLDRINGPRAGWLLSSLDPAFVIHRLREAAGWQDAPAA